MKLHIIQKRLVLLFVLNFLAVPAAARNLADNLPMIMGGLGILNQSACS